MRTISGDGSKRLPREMPVLKEASQQGRNQRKFPGGAEVILAAIMTS